jgi:hypothetical protein
MATKFDGRVICKNIGDCNMFFHITDDKELQLLDADFNIIDSANNSFDDETTVIHVNVLWIKTSYSIQIRIYPYGLYSSYVTFLCPKMLKIRDHYNLCFDKYEYKQIDNYYCKIPKTNMIFWQDNLRFEKYEQKYIQMYLLLSDLHDTRTIIFSNILTYQRLDTNSYPTKK